MENEILNLFGILRAEYLHSHGRNSTDRLIQKLDCQPSDRILEIGVGTGTTMALVASNYRRTNFYGTDRSPLMVSTAHKRLGFCGLMANTQLTLQDDGSSIPFVDAFFDKVYVESVLGIQEGEELRNTAKEISRILKPGGLLIMNETIWLESTTKETAEQINAKCKSAFGIIQSNHEFNHVNAWISLLKDLQFNGIEATKLDGLPVRKRITFPGIYGALSKTFTGLGRLKALFNPELRRLRQEQVRQMEEIMEGRRGLMDGFLISCRKG